MPESIDFHGWVRPAVGDLITAVDAGRPRVTFDATLTAREASGAVSGEDTATLSVLLAGPRDVSGLQPGAVRRRFPQPGAIDAETTKCPCVELADASLLWRYTPLANPDTANLTLRPWLVLLVGTEAELPIVDGRVRPAVPVCADYPLASSARWAHVQRGAGRDIARLLSPRPLAVETEYVAALVPAFTTDGGDAWTAAGGADLPVYDSWRFRTGPGGDFAALARRLQPGTADAALGSAGLGYPRTPGVTLAVRGALTRREATDPALPPEVAEDLPKLATPARDDRGRPVLGLPRYGQDWRAVVAGAAWGRTVNDDPRHRGVAGLGLEIGVIRQEELIQQAADQLGAVEAAAQRIRDLSLGLMASGSLWRRRFPANALRRLWVLGPALRRTVTDEGTLAALATAPDRALPAGIFSAACRRLLRPGPARSSGTSPAVLDPAALLRAANRCPPGDQEAEIGFRPTRLGAAGFFDRIRQLAQALAGPTGGTDLPTEAVTVRPPPIITPPPPPPPPPPQPAPPPQLLAAFATVRAQADPTDRALIDAVVQKIRQLAAQRRPLPWGYLSGLLAALVDQPRDVAAVVGFADPIRNDTAPTESQADLVGLLRALRQPLGAAPPCRPVRLEDLAAGADAAFDPTRPDAPARTRVLSRFDGLDPQAPEAPPELCFQITTPAWRLLADTAPDWLLPGAAGLEQDRVVAMQTNATFVQAMLLGLNGQFLAEARWRNLSVAAGCTPLRTFWGQVDPSGGEPATDIRPVPQWPQTADLGDPRNQPDGPAGPHAVLVARGQLFLRYPATLVYLLSAEHDGAPDFSRDPAPDAGRVLPSFQGRIGSDVMFFGFRGFDPATFGRFWVAFEEPAAGYRFHNNVPAAAAATNGADFAELSFADPARVLIGGSGLMPEERP